MQKILSRSLNWQSASSSGAPEITQLICQAASCITLLWCASSFSYAQKQGEMAENGESGSIHSRRWHMGHGSHSNVIVIVSCTPGFLLSQSTRLAWAWLGWVQLSGKTGISSDKKKQLSSVSIRNFVFSSTDFSFYSCTNKKWTPSITYNKTILLNNGVCKTKCALCLVIHNATTKAQPAIFLSSWATANEV